MKKFFFILLFAAFQMGMVSAQQVIMASEAYRHVGEKVTVWDSVYYGKVYNDSTVVAELGNRRLIAPLTVLFSATKNPLLADPRFIIDYLQRSRINVTGLILLIKGHPTIIVSDWNALKSDRREQLTKY